MSGSFHRHAITLAVLATAGMGSIGGGVESARSLELNRVTGAHQADPSRPTPAPTRGSSMAKLRDLFFHRNGRFRHGYKGVSMSVAQGKRVAKKLRNRQRHKKQWRAHRR